MTALGPYTLLSFSPHTHTHTLAISSYLLLSLSCVAPSTTSSSTAHPHRQCHPVCRLADTKAQTLAFTFILPPEPRTLAYSDTRRVHTFFPSCIVCLSLRHMYFTHTFPRTHTSAALLSLSWNFTF